MKKKKQNTMSTIFKALLSQAGTANPTSTNKVNSLATGLLKLERYDTGQFIVLSPIAKTDAIYFIQENVVDAKYLMYVDDAGNLILETKWDSTGSGDYVYQDGLLVNTPLSIEIF